MQISDEEDSLLDNEFYPDDCLDPLTAEVLSNPIRLPCGKYVNLETLKKYWNSKSDSAPKFNPFTMVPLTDSQVRFVFYDVFYISLDSVSESRRFRETERSGYKDP